MTETESQRPLPLDQPIVNADTMEHEEKSQQKQANLQEPPIPQTQTARTIQLDPLPWLLNRIRQQNES